MEKTARQDVNNELTDEELDAISGGAEVNENTLFTLYCPYCHETHEVNRIFFGHVRPAGMMNWCSGASYMCDTVNMKFYIMKVNGVDGYYDEQKREIRL